MHWGEGTYSPAAHAAPGLRATWPTRFTAYYDGSAGEGATAFLRDALAACAPSNNLLSDARFAWGSLVSLPQGTMASVPGSHVRPGPFS